MKLLDKMRQLTRDDQEIFALLSDGSDGQQSIRGSGSRELVFYARGYPDVPYLTLRFKGNRITRLTPGSPLTKKLQDDLVQRATQALQEDAGSHVVSRHIFAERPLKGQFRVSDELRLSAPPTDTIIGRGLDWFQNSTINCDIATNSHLGPPYPILMEIKVKKSSSMTLQSLWMFRELERYQNALTLLIAADIKYAHFPSERLWITLFRDQRIENHLLRAGFIDPRGVSDDDFLDLQQPIVKMYNGADYYSRLWGQDTELLIPETLGQHLDVMDSLDVDQANKFHRACMWFAQGVQFRSIETICIPSFSAAIECLLPRDDNIKSRFNNIVERYGLFSDSIKSLTKKLYDVRSDLIHGDFAHSSDTGFLSFKHDDYLQNMLMGMSAKRCLIGWLNDPNRP